MRAPPMTPFSSRSSIFCLVNGLLARGCRRFGAHGFKIGVRMPGVVSVIVIFQGLMEVEDDWVLFFDEIGWIHVCDLV